MVTFNNIGLIAILLLSLITFTVCCDQNCKECKLEACSMCVQGYGLAEDGSCQLCSIKYCEDCAEGVAQCKACAPYYYYNIEFQRCMSCSFGCQICQDSQKCLKCGAVFEFQEKNTNYCQLSKYYFMVGLALAIVPLVLYCWVIVYCCRKKTVKGTRPAGEIPLCLSVNDKILSKSTVLGLYKDANLSYKPMKEVIEKSKMKVDS